MATHFYYNGHTYEIETAPLTWGDAATNAAGLSWNDSFSLGVSVSAYLAIIDSAGENEAILKNLKASVRSGSTVAPDGGGADYLWIGGADDVTEGVWQWVDGSNISGYENWGSGNLGSEPDNFGGDQDYLAISLNRWPSGGGIGEAGEWNDLSGGNLLWSIIEWDGIVGTNASELLVGTVGDDVIDGKGGNDNIRGGDGSDTIYAGDGNDRVDAGDGDNSIIAETGTVHSDDGNDNFRSGSGSDLIAAGTGDDVVFAGDGDNIVLGSSGDDRITTGAGNDTIDVDGYYADAGVAAEGNDLIRTGAGDDFIVLGQGYDKVWGGTGADIFKFSWLPEGTSTENVVSDGVVVTKLNIHRIMDFDAGSGGGSTDFIALDPLVFESLESFTATNFAKGKGLSAATDNETGVDDYLLYDTSAGKLYYDADGNGAESAAVLIAIIKGKMSDFNFEDILVF